MILLDELSLVEELDAQLLFREARQRRRRRRTVRSVIVVAVVAAMVVLGFGLHVIPGTGSRSHPSDSRPPLAPDIRSGATLVYAYDNLRVINADTGASRPLPLPAPQGGSSDLSMVRIGGSLLLNRGNTAWLYGTGLHGPPVDLGPSLRVIPGPIASEAWIWSDPCGASVGCDDDGLQQGQLRLVDTSGNQVGSPISLPADATWFPTGDVVNAGLVLAVASIGPDAEEIWNPITDQVVRVFPGADVLAASGDVVAWTSGRACLPDCTVHFTDVQTGIEQTFDLPSGVAGADEGAFSPDGSTFALPVGIGGPPGTHPGALALVDLRTHSVSLLPGTEEALGPRYGSQVAPQVAFWSSSGWLFVTLVGGSQVLVWRPGDERATVLPKVRLPRLSLSQLTDYPNAIAM